MSSNPLQRAVDEVGHWLRREWSFADVGMHWDLTEDYDEVNAETYSYFRRFTDGMRLSDDCMAQGAHVLDFCARTGNGTLHFYQHGKVGSAVCVDVSERQGEICRQRLEDGGLERFLWVKVGDPVFPFRDGECDAVLCFETIEHFPKPGVLVVELGRVTRAGGVMVLTTPNVLWEPAHALAAVLGLHHSEGPHRFIGYGRLVRMVSGAGFEIARAETTVLIPAGPPAVVRLGEWIERETKDTLMPWLGLRRVLVCRKQ